MVYLVILFLVSLVLFIIKGKRMVVIPFKKHFLSLIIILLMMGMICFSNTSIQVTKNSIELWANNVFPTLLPFFICMELLKQTNFLALISKSLTPIMRPLFGLPGSGALALLLGITSGYPVGAKVSNDLYQKKLCTKAEAEKMIAFTNSSGPLFIMGAIGNNMFFDSRIGLLLFMTHFMASITVGILLKKHHLSPKLPHIISQVSIKSNTSSQIQLSSLGKNMACAIQNSISTLTMILGYMVFFGILGNFMIQTGITKLFVKIITPILSSFHLSNHLSNGILSGLLEITGGIKEIAHEIRIPLIQKLCTTAFLLGFGGFSVHMQVLSIVSESRLSIKLYLIGKILQGILAALYTYLLAKNTSFFHFDIVESFHYQSAPLPILSESNHFMVTLFLFTLMIILAKIIKIMSNKPN